MASITIQAGKLSGTQIWILGVQHGSTLPVANLTDEANSLAEAVMSADAPTHVDTTRKDLVTALKMLLHGRLDVPKIHRKVKQFVYGLHSDVLKELSASTGHRPGGSLTLSLEQQEDLLQRALRCGDVGEDLLQRALGCGDVGDYQEDDSDSAMQAVDSMSSKISSIDVAKSMNAIHGQKAKKRLMKTRQMIDKHPPFTMKWVVMDDVIDEVKAAGVKNPGDAVRRAQKIWDQVCFKLDIYSTGGKEGTKAEFMFEWLHRGYTWDACIAHLKTLSPTKGLARAPPETFKTDTQKRLRENAAKTYAPQNFWRSMMGKWGNLCFTRHSIERRLGGMMLHDETDLLVNVC